MCMMQQTATSSHDHPAETRTAGPIDNESSVTSVHTDIDFSLIA